ncbi:unnamed protein product [Prunus armeniaca]
MKSHDGWFEKQVFEGTLTVSGSNNVLTLALGTPEHGGRVRGVGDGVSPTQFFNLPRQQRVKFADKLKESVMEAVGEETKKMEARAKESVMEAVRAEREILLKQFSQLIPNFDPNLLGKTPTTPITPIPQEQSSKNPMSDKASCSNVRALELDEDNLTNDADAAENRQDEMDLSKLDMPAPLLGLCQYAETKLKPANKTIRIHMPEEMFGTDHDTWLLSEDILQFASMVEIGSTVIAVYMRYRFDYLKMANMVNLVGLMDPGQVSSQSGTLSHRSKHLSEHLKTQMEINFTWCLIIQGIRKYTYEMHKTGSAHPGRWGRSQTGSREDPIGLLDEATKDGDFDVVEGLLDLAPSHR